MSSVSYVSYVKGRALHNAMSCTVHNNTNTNIQWFMSTPFTTIILAHLLFIIMNIMFYPHIQRFKLFCKHKAHQMLNANLDQNKLNLSALKPQTVYKNKKSIAAKWLKPTQGKR